MGPQVSALRSGCDIVVATPGRLLDHCRRGTTRLGALEVLVVDEADRMMDMGFLPDLRRILAALPRERQSMLFSATMPFAVLELAYEEILRDPVLVEVGSQCAPPATIAQSVYLVASDRKTDLLLDLLRREAMRSVLVFARTRRRAERLTRQLQRSNTNASCIHGDRSQSQRERALERFRRRSLRVLVATDIAARGLDVEGVTHVVNYDMPAVPLDYIHRIGRTARAGSDGEALSLAAQEDASVLADIERTLGRQIPRVTVAGLTEPELARKAPAPARPFSRFSRMRRRPVRSRRR